MKKWSTIYKWLKIPLFIIFILALTFPVVSNIVLAEQPAPASIDPKNSGGAWGSKPKTDEEVAKEQAEEEQKKLEGGFGNCKLDPSCYFEAWLYKSAKWLMENALALVGKFTVQPATILENTTVKKYYGYFEDLSWTFLILFLIYQCIRFIVMYNVEENPAEFKLLLRKLIFSAFMIGSLPTVFRWLLNLNNWMVEGLADGGLKMEQFSKTFGAAAVEGAVLIICLLLLAVMMLVICFQMSIRSAELILLLILGPFCIATNVNSEYNLFPVWWRHLLSTVFTQALQVLMIVLMTTFFVETRAANLENFVFAIGFVFLIIKAPGFLKEWMYSTGSGRAAAGATIGAASTVMRSVIRKKVG
ncbi:hypothetical protein SAMN04487866_12241 [Thermoactinomyces sp. DSM 45891]|uniref:conjugal transfer protein TrbL family protein n=1 Tax=Thermoactinomyces sp. DSM 45891 TaxID=1761907 RepID=UPI0009233D49|nr:conjugal transfer protein TrbL family protein [Thermoactinomyces sp. DSM 45891]SFX75258.1 hypothetical protein SAMN04487866_12241 [Thermoactinomyces sp. DSM 45891]